MSASLGYGQSRYFPMNISLDEAIEIHVRALKHRWHKKPPPYARLRAATLKEAGDHEGHNVWILMAEVAERLLTEAQK